MATVNATNDGSSSEEESVSTLPDLVGRAKTLTFVKMDKRLEKTPRGITWDKLNREGKVKEIPFDTKYTSENMKAAIRKNFAGLEKVDFGR